MPPGDAAVCPVPPEQRPTEEYAALTDSCGFAACTRVGPYWRRLAWVWGLSWIVTGPVSAASFAPEDDPLQFFLAASAGASLVLGLELVRLYVGWRYIDRRLRSPVVTYEESGWYDGRTWRKPTAMHDRDRLIATYNVQPILDRLTRSLAIVGIFSLSGAIAWSLL